ncbi:MAG: L-histidine N(alpha)-methyltransferase [Verrucomicrobiota bacterium]
MNSDDNWLSIQWHLNRTDQALVARWAKELLDNNVPPAFHYQTNEQANRWRAVFETHAPIHHDNPVKELYRKGLIDLAAAIPAGITRLVSIGCGTGEKDLLVGSQLEAIRGPLGYLAIDLSPNLVAEAVARFVDQLPSWKVSGAVCDFDAVKSEDPFFLGTERTCFLCFGILPNYLPQRFFEQIKKQMKPEDLLVIGANLIPDEREQTRSKILSQYANKETESWLTLALDLVALEKKNFHLDWNVVKTTWGYSLEAFVTAEENDTMRYGDVSKKLASGEQLRLFASYRFKLDTFKEAVKQHGFQVIDSRVSACGEEGLFTLALV